MKKFTLSLQILTISIDALGILLSLFSIDSFDNIKLKFIIHLCQAFRTELILLLILLFCVFFFIPFAYRHYLITDRFNKFLCISAVLVAAVLFYPYVLKYAKARYYYFNNNILESHAQFSAIEKGLNFLRDGEYNMAKDEFNLVNQFSASSKYNNIVQTYMYEIGLNINTTEYIYENFVVNNEDLEDKAYKLHACVNLNPSEYRYYYESLMTEINDAINNYPKLYQALAEDNYLTCRELINTYGDVWFEKIVKEKLLHDNKKYIMNLLHQYLDNENCISGQQRLKSKYNL